MEGREGGRWVEGRVEVWEGGRVEGREGGLEGGRVEGRVGGRKREQEMTERKEDRK